MQDAHPSLISILNQQRHYERCISIENHRVKKHWYEYTFEAYLAKEIKRQSRGPKIHNEKHEVQIKKNFQEENTQRITTKVTHEEKPEPKATKKKKSTTHSLESYSEVWEAAVAGYRVRRKLASGKGRELVESITYIRSMLRSEEDKNNEFYRNLKKQLIKTESEFYEFMNDNLPYMLEYDTLHKPVTKATKPKSKKTFQVAGRTAPPSQNRKRSASSKRLVCDLIHLLIIIS
jgi:hypothetical protein